MNLGVDLGALAPIVPVFAAAAAAAVGGVVRVASDHLISKHLKEPGTGIAVVNAIGCFLLGLLYVHTADVALARVVLVGFLGGLTTFSTAMIDVVLLADQGRWPRAFLLLTGTIVLCVTAFGIGAGIMAWTV